VKKQTPKPKLTLQRETLANLERVVAGVDTSLINNTVYYPPKKQFTDTSGSIA